MQMEMCDCRRHMPKFHVIYYESVFMALISDGDRNKWPIAAYWINVENCIFTAAEIQCQAKKPQPHADSESFYQGTRVNSIS